MLKRFGVREDWAPEQWDDWGLELPQWSHVKTGPQSGKGRRCIVDIEADGLLEQQGSKKAATRFWCIACVDVDTGEEFYWGWDQQPADTDRFDWLANSLAFMGECDLLLAHNGIGFDYPVCEKLYGWKRPAKSWDTLSIAKVIWPYDSLIGPDLDRIRKGKLPGQLLKSHSLKAWGYRTGTHKGEYSGGFDEWCPAMAVYLMGDIRGTLALWRLIEKRLGWAKDTPADALVWPELTIEVENEVARIIHQQKTFGANFDVAAAVKLAADLANEKRRIDEALKATFGSWWQPSPVVTPSIERAVKMVGWEEVTIQRVSEKTGKALKPYVGPPQCHYSPDAPYTPIERVDFNPSSREHLGQRLVEVFGWKPKAFGKAKRDGTPGAPTVDETTLEAIPDAVMPAETRQLILDYFVVAKTLGMLAQGQKAWLRMVGEDGRIHGDMDTCGAVTRRGTHKNPNLSQVPSITKAKDEHGVEHILFGLAGRYGYECRALFTADDGWEQSGTDASSLELIDLGHYLHASDKGKFSDRVCDPNRDAHTEHSVLCGTTRADAKTTIYLFVYGGSAYKLSLDPGIKVTPDMVPKLLCYRGLPMLLKSLERRFDTEFVRKMDDMQKARVAHCRQVILKLEEGIVGLKDLKEGVSKAAERGWLKSIDGSRIVVRKPHAALNSLLQSAGAISCKLWMVLFHREMERRGYLIGRDWKQVLWVHDELQITHKPGLGPVIKEVSEQCMVQAGETLGLRGRYRTETKTGQNWAQTH